MRHLSAEQLGAFERAVRDWVAEGSEKCVRYRGRYLMTFLVLRYTGARLGEVLLLQPWRDVDFGTGDIRLRTLKRRRGDAVRYVPVPQRLIAELATYMARFPDMAERVFQLDPGNVRRVFAECGVRAGLPRNLAHPHVLRHTRAFELLRAGVPVTMVQDVLGHASLLTTAAYLRASGAELRSVLLDKGLML